MPLVLAVDVAQPQPLRVDARLGGQHTLHKLLVGHLQTEYRHPLAILARGRLGHRDGQRGFANAGAGRQDDEVALLQAAQHLVQQFEAGGHAQNLAAVVVQEVDAVHHVAHDRSHRHQVAVGPFLGDAKDDLFGAIHHLLHIFSRVFVGQLRDLAGGPDELAQHRSPFHDMAIVLDVDGGRHGIDQVHHVGRAADLDQLPPPLQFVGDGDEVGRIAPFVQVNDGLVDPAVLFLVEVLSFEKRRDLDDGVGIDEQRSQHRLLGLGVGRHESLA